MADVFLSYKREDAVRVRKLVAALRKVGFETWWDEDIPGGAQWETSIEQALLEAKAVVVCWSPVSVTSENVRSEARVAREDGRLVQVFLKPCVPPLFFGERQGIDLSRWHGNPDDPHITKLADNIRGVASGQRVADQSLAHGPDRSQLRISRRMAIAGGVGVGALAVIGSGGYFMLKPWFSSVPASIAVLPFANLSGDPAKAYFSDGIADEIRSALARLGGLTVIGSTSSEAVRNEDARTAARRLGVTHILTGNVRQSPSIIRVSAELVDGLTGADRWTQNYDRAPGDAIKIQTDIAESVAQALSVALGRAGRAALSLGGTTNPAAQDLVLKVIHDTSDSEVGYERKIALLDSAISLDPNYAQAYARKADVLASKVGEYARSADAFGRGFAEALDVANRSIAIAPAMARGYEARSFVYLLRLQIGFALADARHAMALPGENPSVIDAYAFLLGLTGRFPEALRLSARATSLDPLSPDAYANRAIIQLYGRNYSEAILNARRSLALGPDQTDIRGILGNALLFQGKLSDAQTEYRKIDPADYRSLEGEAVVAIRAGRQAEAREKLKTLQDRYRDAAHYEYAKIYSQLGMIEAAFKELEQAWELRDPGLVIIKVDPFLDPLRHDPRMATIEQKIGFS